MSKVERRKKIVFTGGGSVGHVAPNLAVINKLLQEKKYNIHYIGSCNGIEKELITRISIPYHSITVGKLRRYFSWQNFLDPLRIIMGIGQAFFLLRHLKPGVVFSKGGFVAFPVVIAAGILGIPIIVHEADLTIGLANRWSFFWATKICITFPETLESIAEKYHHRVVISGLPIRDGFFKIDVARGRDFCGFTERKKIIAILGGSLGAAKINQVVHNILPSLVKKFQVIHICGRGMIEKNISHSDYRQFAYVHEELPHILAAADLVIARAGANTLYELLTLRKPNILLPLSSVASRGDQVVNAKYFLAQGFSAVIFDEELKEEALLTKIAEVIDASGIAMAHRLSQIKLPNAVAIISQLIDDLAR